MLGVYIYIYIIYIIYIYNCFGWCRVMGFPVDILVHFFFMVLNNLRFLAGSAFVVTFICSISVCHGGQRRLSEEVG